MKLADELILKERQ